MPRPTYPYLVKASASFEGEVSGETLAFPRRMLDSHDLWGSNLGESWATSQNAGLPIAAAVFAVVLHYTTPAASWASPQ